MMFLTISQLFFGFKNLMYVGVITNFGTAKKLCYIAEIYTAELNNKYTIYGQLIKDKRK